MLYFVRIDVSEELMLIKKECDICHYWYFVSFNFKFQPTACNKCHDLLMTSKNISNITILNIKGSDYCCIIGLIR